MAHTPDHTLIVSPDVAALVHARVAQGAYASDGDVVREAMLALEQRDTQRAQFREKIRAGMASLRAGHGSDGESYLAALDDELAEHERQGR